MAHNAEQGGTDELLSSAATVIKGKAQCTARSEEKKIVSGKRSRGQIIRSNKIEGPHKKKGKEKHRKKEREGTGEIH